MSRYVFYDPNLPEIKELLTNIVQGAKAFPVSSDSFFLKLKALISVENDLTFDVICHGKPGGLSLGGKVISLSDWEANFKFGHTTNVKQINFWSCRTGSGQVGSNYVTQIANLTGAQVSASSDDVGHASLNASWELNISAGPIPPFEKLSLIHISEPTRPY